MELKILAEVYNTDLVVGSTKHVVNFIVLLLFCFILQNRFCQ